MIRPREWTRLLSSRLALLAILLIAFGLYAPTLDDWFSGDDFWFLRSSQAIPVGEYTVKSLDFRGTGTLPEFDRYRPLYPIAWRLEYEAFGLDALGYRVVLVGLHLGCVVLVWFIAFRLTKGAWAANLAALIFAVHPAYASAVAWISGGNRVFVTFPYLLGFLLFMKYLDGGSRQAMCYVGSLLSFVAAILFHSSALTLAAVLPAYTFLVAETPRDALRAQSWLRFAPFAVVTVALVGIQVWVRSNLNAEGAFQVGWHQYVNYGRFLGLALFPGSMVPGSGWVAELMSDLELAASVVMILASIGLLMWRRPAYLGVFVVWWVYISLLPDTLLRLGAFGRTLYLPGASLAILFVLWLLWLKGTLPSSALRLAARVAPLLLVTVLVPGALLTLHEEDGPGSAGAENDEFAGELQEAIPSLDAQATLYVVGAPANLVAFQTDSRLDALVELYYGEVEVRRLARDQVAEVEASLGEKDRIFRFER